jgi:hypothetical protein
MRNSHLVRRAALLPNGRCTLASDKARHPFPYGKHMGTERATRSDKLCRPLLVTESKIVTPFSKNCYIKTGCTEFTQMKDEDIIVNK